MNEPPSAATWVRFARALFVVLALIATVGAARAQSDLAQDRERRYAAFVDNLLTQIPLVWKENLVPAIEGAVPNVDRALLRRIEVRVVEDACLFQASTSKEPDGKRVVQISTGLLRLWLYAEQARLLFFTSDPRVNRADIWIDYLISRRELVAKVRRTCVQDPAAGRKELPGYSVAAELGVIGEEYERMLAMASEDQLLVKLGDQFATGLFFVVLHEAAHHILGHFDASRSQLNIEIEADNFAAAVIRHWKYSTFVGVGAIAAMVFSTPGTRSEHFCRVRSLTASDRHIENQLSDAGIVMFSDRMRQHQVAFNRRIDALCDRP